MNTTGGTFDPSIGECRSGSWLRNVPWQIWVVVVVLAVEGVFGNVPLIPQVPKAAIWLAAKCLFVVGLVRGWRWVFVLFLVSGVIHVLAFSIHAPFVAFVNLVIVLLTASALRFYFPKTIATNTDLRTRRWFQYSLWALPAMLLASIGLSWFLAHLDWARKQRVVVEALEKAGPRVRIEYSDPLAPVFREIIGRDLFCEVFAVDASSVRSFSDEHASYLARLPNLVALSLADTQVTDAGLKHLEGVSSLQYVWLDYSQVTDAGLEHLKGLTHLQQLGLSGTKVTNDGTKRLQQALPHCRIRRSGNAKEKREER